MAGTSRYSIYPARFVQGGTTLLLQQIHGVTVSPNASKDVVIPGGALDPSAIPMVTADPSVTLMTHDLTTLLATVSVSAGFPVTTSFMVQFQQRDDGATFLGSTNHVTVTGTLGWFAVTSFAASQDDANGAVAECQLWALYDGSNAPLVYTTSQALTSTPAFTSKFYLGPVYVNGSALDGVQSVRVNTGIGYRAVRGSGDVYATKGSIYTRTPTIEVTFTNAAGLPSSLFNNSLPGTIAVYFWKGVSGSSRVAVGSSVHCKLSAAAGVYSPQTMSVSNNEDGTVTLTAQVTGTMSSSITSTIP